MGFCIWSYTYHTSLESFRQKQLTDTSFSYPDPHYDDQEAQEHPPSVFFKGRESLGVICIWYSEYDTFVYSLIQNQFTDISFCYTDLHHEDLKAKENPLIVYK